jgi:hypothetical protein
MEQRGIQTFLAIIPKKSTIDPSLLPGYLRERCIDSPDPASYAFERLSAQNVNVAYDVEWFRDTGIDTLFERRSYHWHVGGGMRYGEFLFNDGILSTLGQTGIIVDPNDSIEQPDFIDLAYRMGVGETEFTYMRPRYAESLTSVIDGQELRDAYGIDYSAFINRGALRRLRVTQGRESTGRALIFGDSFSSQISLYLARHFEESLVTRTNFMGRNLFAGQIDGLVDQFEPDYIILVMVESKFAPVDPEDGLNNIEAFLPAGQRIARNNWRIRN